jgi:uncharacterized protein YcbK (DUF882 family)
LAVLCIATSDGSELVQFGNARLNPLPLICSSAGRRIGLAVLLCVAAVDGLQDAAANGETRTLTIHHSHTKEDITVTYKRNGRFDEDGLAKLNHFLRDWRNHDVTKMDPRLFDILWEVYQEVGAKQPIVIISAYRSPATNSMLRRRSRGVAKHSQHILGRAIDFNIPDAPLDQIRAAGLRLQRGGVGFYPSSGSPFVHMDVGSVRHWPRMSPDAYARVMQGAGRSIFARRGGTTAVASNNTEASAARPARQRSWFARWIGGGGTDEAEDTPEERAAGRTPPKAKDTAPQQRPTQVASAPTPMPRMRPGNGDGKLVPVPPRLTPSQVVQERGLWQASAAMAAADATAKPSPDGRRLVWQVGAQAVTKGDSTVVAKRTPAPRPRPELATASIADTTASVPWPTGAHDRVPSEVALAYAAEPPVAQAGRPAATTAAPMGALAKPASPRAAKAPPRSATPVRPVVPAGRLVENPWLRGIMLASSVHVAMDVTVLGLPNYRAIAPLMRKPGSAVSNTFTDDPTFGLNALAFSGAAVSFVPTITFGTITASRW